MNLVPYSPQSSAASASGSSLSRPCLRWQASQTKLRNAFSGYACEDGLGVSSRLTAHQGWDSLSVSLGSPTLKRRLIYRNPTLSRRVLCLTRPARKGLPFKTLQEKNEREPSHV